MAHRQTISADTFFHFTDKISKVKGILKNGFRASYCYEEIPFNISGGHLAIPMVCFCDLPLSLTKNHIQKYGGFGIGMKKSWGLENEISSINYVQPNGLMKKKFDLVLQLLSDYDWNIKMNDGIQALKVLDELKFQLYFSKRHEFYDEREWRFFPENSDIIIKEDENEIKSTIENYNKSPNLYYLEFGLADIKYIIVKTESQKNRIQNKIGREVNILLLKQVLNDF